MLVVVIISIMVLLSLVGLIVFLSIMRDVPNFVETETSTDDMSDIELAFDELIEDYLIP